MVRLSNVEYQDLKSAAYQWVSRSISPVLDVETQIWPNSYRIFVHGWQIANDWELPSYGGLTGASVPCSNDLTHASPLFAVSIHACSPHSVALMQLRFTSFAVISLRWDFYPQDCAPWWAQSKKKACISAGFSLSGSTTWTRTRDPMINSHLLYQLSYRGMRRMLLIKKKKSSLP